MRTPRPAVATSAALAVALLAGLTACGGSSDADAGASSDDFTVGVVALDATQITANRERAASQEAMKKLGWKTVEVNSNGNPANAITAMQNLIQRKVDAIVVQTYTADQLTTGLAAAKAANIPVFSSAGGEAGPGMAGAIEINAAAPVNDAMLATLKDKPKVEMLQLRYTPGAPCRARADDLDAKLKDMPNVNVTRQEVTIPGGEQSAQQSTSGWLQAHPESPEVTLVIWPCFSEAAIGAVSAEKQLNRGPYPLYTWDISEPAIAAVKAGQVSAVLWIKVDETGQQMAQLIDDYRKAGSSWTPKTETGPSELITKDNIDQILAANPDLGK